MRLRLPAWLTMVAVLGAGVPCGAWSALAPDCCAEQPCTEHAMPAGHEHVAAGASAEPHAGHAPAAAGGDRTAPASPAVMTGPAGAPRHHVPSSMADCCLSAPESRADEAPRVTAQSFVLHQPSDAVAAHAALVVPAPPRPPREPLPPGGTARHVLLSTFLI